MPIGTRRRFLQAGALAAAGMAAGRSGMAAAVVEGTRDVTPKAAAAKAGTRIPLRGLMVDAGRVPERMEYYRRVIGFCAEWGLNALQFRLADDQGSVLRFGTVPGLVNHANAFTPEELRGLAEFGASHGVDVIPELESFGHTGYITRSPRYAHLSDADANGVAEFTGICPVNPETLELFRAMYAEVAAIFPSRSLHGGCDEVNWGGSARSRAALKTKSRSAIWAEYVNALDGIAEAQGKEFIVWGDVVLHKEPEILPLLKKSIIVMDWDYSVNNALPVQAGLGKARAHGLRAMGAPALTRHGWGPRVGTEQLRNIDAFADTYFGSGDDGVLGVILTNWIPSRYVQSSIWDGFAYAAVAFQQGTAVAQTSAFHHFVERHYGATWNASWDAVFAMLYDFAPLLPERGTEAQMALPFRVPWSSDAELKAVMDGPAVPSNPFTAVTKLLATLAPTVRANVEDFRALRLAVGSLEHLYWREAAVRERASMHREDAARRMREIAERDRALAAALATEWDRGRFADSPAKAELLFDLEPVDQWLYGWTKAAEYSARLAHG